jgi:hypothetical protein
MQPCRSPFYLVAILLVATRPPRVLLSPLRPSMLPPILPHIVVLHLLWPTLHLVLDPLVLFLGLLAPLNFNLFFVFSKTLLHMILTYRCPNLWNVQIAFFYDITYLLHTLRMRMNATTISLLTVEYSTL